MLYYLQRHQSGYLGNAPIWWCKDDAGYSAYLENAKKFTKAEAENILGCEIDQKSDKFKAWPCDFIDGRTFTVYDMQYFRDFEQWQLLQDKVDPVFSCDDNKSASAAERN